MNLTGEQLSELQTMAGLFFSIDKIRIALGIPYALQEVFSDCVRYEEKHPAFIAYHTGRITAEIEIRNSIKNAALNGSNPAQNTLVEFLNSTKSDD